MVRHEKRIRLSCCGGLNKDVNVMATTSYKAEAFEHRPLKSITITTSPQYCIADAQRRGERIATRKMWESDTLFCGKSVQVLDKN
jgi:hypothetical protein